MRERTVLKIGEFARVNQVSIATLRYYDHCGLLKPLALDPETGYRYYSLDQLPRLNRILALKELGFPLEQIAQLLEEGNVQAYFRRTAQLTQDAFPPTLGPAERHPPGKREWATSRAVEQVLPSPLLLR
jgi:DNA-binding transcriptional MerR regulator